MFLHLCLTVLFQQALTEVGTVQSVLDSGDIRVRYPNNLVWTMNSEAVVKVAKVCFSQ